MVPDSPDVEGVVSGADGVFANAKPGACGSMPAASAPTSPNGSADDAKAAGIRPLDAPVSGGEQGAIDAALSIMVGGDAADFEAAQDVLNAVGKTIVHVGPSGSGQTVKAANQLIVAVNIQVLGEAVAFLEAYGVDTDAALKVLGGGLAGSKVLDQKGQKMLDRDFDPGFRLALHHKDIGIVTSAAREASVALPLGALAAQLVAATVNQGDGGLDHSGLFKQALQLSGRNVTPAHAQPPPGDRPDHSRASLQHAQKQTFKEHTMTKMRTVDAAVAILDKEGATEAFGLPGAAINPFYSAMRAHGGIRHTLARHVEGASHMADGYCRAKDGNIGICIGTSGPAGTDMITGLYAAWADSIPMLCITGQAPVAKLHKEDFQAVDIESIAKPVTKMAMTILEPGQVPGAFQKAFQLMRSGRPGPVLLDLPIDVQMAEIEFDIDTYEPLPGGEAQGQPQAAGKGTGHAHRSAAPADRGRRRHDQCLRVGATGGTGRTAERPGHPHPDGLGHHPGRPPPDGRHGRPADLATATATRTILASDFVIGIGNRWANRHTGGLDTYTAGRKFVHIDIEPTQIGRVFSPDSGHRLRRRRRAGRPGGTRPRTQGRRHLAGLQRLGCRVLRAQGHAAPQDALR